MKNKKIIFKKIYIYFHNQLILTNIFLFESTVLVIIFCNFQNVLVQILLATSTTIVISLSLSYDYGITDHILIHKLQTTWKLENPRKLENSRKIG